MRNRALYFVQFLIALHASGPALCAEAGGRAAGQTSFPIRVSENGRYFVGKNGAAFLYHADTAWSAPWAVTPEEIEEYLVDREKKGFTAIQMWAVSCEGNASNSRGEKPFRGKPFDIVTVNEAYFSNIDSIIRKAAAKNMLVVIAPAWFGADGICNRGRLNTNNAAAYGGWLGKRYKGFDNVAWIMGGDNNLVMGGSDMTPVVRAMAKAIRTAAPRQLMTFHSKGGVGSGAIAHEEPWLDFNMAYAYQSSTWHSGPELYPQFEADFRRKPSKPFILGEAHYDWPGTEWIGLPIRRQVYWALLSGGAGHAYGQQSTMDFGQCCEINWREGLNAPSAVSMKHIKEVFGTRAWEKLVPDLDHQVITEGYEQGGSYAPFALASDGSFGLAYLPKARLVTVKMSRFSGPVTGKWFDPTSGATQMIPESPFANEGSRSFRPPPANASGDSDWVLILER